MSIITDRLGNLKDLALCAIIDVPIVTCVTGYGVVKSALSVLTLGVSEWANSGAENACEANSVLSDLYSGAVKVINPAAKFIHPTIIRTDSSIRMGFLTELAARPIFVKAKELSQGSFIKKHVFSRFAYGLGATVAAVTRTADLAFGLIATAFSFLTLGAVPMINSIAFRQLTVLGLINDVCGGIRGFVNPQQFHS